MFMRRCVFGRSLVCFPFTRDLICGIFWELYYLLFFLLGLRDIFSGVSKSWPTRDGYILLLSYLERFFFSYRVAPFKAHRSLAGGLFEGKCLFQASNEFLCPSGKNDSHCKITFYNPPLLVPIFFYKLFLLFFWHKCNNIFKGIGLFYRGYWIFNKVGIFL